MQTPRVFRHRIFSLGWTLLTSCVALGAAWPAAAHDGRSVWVSLEDGGEVVAIDGPSVAARIPVGKRPRGIKVSPDGKTLYVALSGSPRAAPGADESKLPPADRAADGVGVVDIGQRKLVRVLHSGQDPESFDLSRDGKTIYVSNEETAKMTVVDIASGKIKREVDVGHEPEGVTLRPDGKVVYVTSEQDNVVVAVATDTFKVLAQMPTGPRPRSIAFTPDGKTAFVTNENGAQLTVLDTAKNVPAGTIKIEAKAKTPLGPRPMGSVMSADGKTLFVSCGRGGSVAVIDVAARKVARLIDGVGARPWGIAYEWTPAGGRLYTANGPSNDVSIIDVGSDKIERVAVGGSPWGAAIMPSHGLPKAGRPTEPKPASSGKP
jgi:YVTN family beta-propeller protein